MAAKQQSAFTTSISKGRLEFLFDGIFAIAMTILVLELKLPESLQDRSSAHELGQALLRHWRTFFSYIVSFAVLSGFWVGHNTIYSKLKRITKLVLVIHVWLLAWAAFIPFCAHLIGRFPSNPLTLTVYLATALAYSLGMLALIVTAEKQGLFDAAIPAADVKKLRRGLIRSQAAMAFLMLYYIFVMPLFK